MSALFSKCTMLTVGIAFLIWCACHSLAYIVPSDVSGFLVIPIFVIQSMFLLFFILLLFSGNIPSLLLILTTFDFWIKLGYSLGFYIAGFIVWARIGTDWWWVLVFGIDGVIMILLIVNLSLIEGFHGNWKYSFASGLLVSLISSTIAFLFTFDLVGFGDVQLELWPGSSFAMIPFIASCMRVVSLFLWKQTVMAAYTRGEWCICIYLSPYIKWSDESSMGEFAKVVEGRKVQNE